MHCLPFKYPRVTINLRLLPNVVGLIGLAMFWSEVYWALGIAMGMIGWLSIDFFLVRPKVKVLLRNYASVLAQPKVEPETAIKIAGNIRWLAYLDSSHEVRILWCRVAFTLGHFESVVSVLRSLLPMMSPTQDMAPITLLLKAAINCDDFSTIKFCLRELEDPMDKDILLQFQVEQLIGDYPELLAMVSERGIHLTQSPQSS